MADRITLPEVRLSFPHLFKRSSFQGEEGKYQATFVLDPKRQAGVVKAVRKGVQDCARDAKIRVKEDRQPVRDGSEWDYEGWDGMVVVKATSKHKPQVLDRNLEPISEDDDRIYPGCVVNARIGFWAQDNQYGQRVVAILHGVQFVRDDEPYGAGRVDVSEEFEDLDGDGEEF